MTPEKRALLKSFVDNAPLVDAVREVLLSAVSPDGIATFIMQLDRSTPDAEYGQQVKARAEAADLLDKGFAQLRVAANSTGTVQSRQNSAR